MVFVYVTCKWGVTENVDGWRWWAVDGAWMCDGVAASRDEAVREVERWAMTARPVVAGGGEGDNRPWRPLLTEEDWQSFPTDPETRDTVLDYLAERGYLAVRDDDSEATR